jgi:phosphate transport system protein
MPNQKALDELRELHREFLELATGVEEHVTAAVLTIRDPDPDGFPAPGAVNALSARRCRLTERCQRILLLYQPVAGDFREVVALLRMGPELEHIGHLAAAIAERSEVLAAVSVSVPAELIRLAEVVSGMVHRVLDAFTLLDAEPVRPIVWMRTEVRGLAGVLTDGLIEAMTSDLGVEAGLNLFAVTQDLQRIAEHATALAEEVAVLTGAPSPRFRTSGTVAIRTELTHATHDS